MAQQATEYPATSCKDNGVFKDTTLENCKVACDSEDQLNWVDYAVGPTTDDSTIYRFTSCNCTIRPDFFRCVDKVPVFEYLGPISDCGEYNITSVQQCTDFCSEWGTVKIDASIKRDIECNCAGLKICGSGATSVLNTRSAATITAATAGLAWLAFDTITSLL